MNRLVRAVIANGGTTSSAVDVRGFNRYAFELGDFTGATFTIHGSRTPDGTFREVVGSTGTALSVTATDGKLITLSSDQNDQLAPLHWLKIVSAGAEAAERTVWVHGA
jgi:hypothetical protein